MNDRQKILGEYFSLTLEILNALEERNLEKADLLKKKRSLYDLSMRDGSYFLRKMEEYFLDALTYRPPSWIDALSLYQEMIEEGRSHESLQFLWKPSLSA